MGKSTAAQQKKIKNFQTNKVKKIAHFKNSLKMGKKTVFSNKKNVGTQSLYSTSNSEKNLKNRLKKILKKDDDTAEKKSQHINRDSKKSKEPLSRQFYETDSNKKFVLNIPTFEAEKFSGNPIDKTSNRQKSAAKLISNGIKDMKKSISRRESKFKSSKSQASEDKEVANKEKKTKKLSIKKEKSKERIETSYNVHHKVEVKREIPELNPAVTLQTKLVTDIPRTLSQSNPSKLKNVSPKSEIFNGIKGKKNKNKQSIAPLIATKSLTSVGSKRKLVKDMPRTSSQPKQCKFDISSSNSENLNGTKSKNKKNLVKVTPLSEQTQKIEESTVSSDSADSDYIHKFFGNSEETNTVDDICEEDESVYEDESEYDDFCSDSASDNNTSDASIKSIPTEEGEYISSASDVDTCQQEKLKFGTSDSAIVRYSSTNTIRPDSHSHISDSSTSEEDEESLLNSFSDSLSDEDEFDSENYSDSEEESSTDGYSFGELTDDDDYELPESENEDLYIRRGEARIYEVEDQDITFDSDDSSAQIFELTAKNAIATNTDCDSDTSCPDLVPITYDNFVHIEDIPTTKGEDGGTDIKRHESISKENGTTFNLDSSSSEYSSRESDTEWFIKQSDDECESESTCEDATDSNSSSELANISKKNGNDGEHAMKTPESTSIEKHSVENSCIGNDSESGTNHSVEFESESSIPFYDIIKSHSSSKLTNGPQINTVLLPNSVQKTISTPIQKTTIPKLQNGNHMTTNFKTGNENASPNPAKFIKANNSNNKNKENVRHAGQLTARFFNSFNSRHVLLLLKGEIYIQGTMKATLVAGKAEIFGHNLEKNKTIELFSPKGYTFLGISTKPGMPDIKCDISTELDVYKNDFMKIDLNEIIDQFEETKHAIILLERNDRSKNVEIVTRFLKENIFPNMNSINISNEFYESEFILRSLVSTQCNNKLVINQKWKCFDIHSNSKILPIGGKGVGKSTMIRYFVNRILPKYKQCVLLDLDIGQPEIFLPQTISATIIDKPLLGPGYFYCTNPEKAFMFGDIDVVMSPSTYLKQVLALIKHCHEDYRFSNIPWIVNTMGYNKGCGSELISIIISQLKPTDVIQIQSSNNMNNYDYIMTPENVKFIPRYIFTDSDLFIDEDLRYTLHIYDSLLDVKPKIGEWDMTPKDKRFATIMSWLGTILSDRSDWFTDVKPYSASINDLEIIYYGEENIPNCDILDVLYANIAYLCKKSSADLIECYGIGIVRGIDQTQQKLYLIPSVTTEVLANINTLAISNASLPTSLILNQGPKVKGLVPYCYNTGNFASSKHIHQFIYRPKSFLEGSRNLNS